MLGDAIDYGRQAEILAREALLKTGITPLELNTQKIDAIIAERYRSVEDKKGFKSNVQRKANLITLQKQTP